MRGPNKHNTLLARRLRRWPNIKKVVVTGPVLVPSQLHEKHTVLQRFRRIEIIVHIAIYVLLGRPTHFLVQAKHLKINPYSAGIDFSRQNLTSVDVLFWRLKSIPAL